MRYFFLIVVLGLLVFACDSSRVYEVNKDFNDRAWKTTDTTVFDFRISNIGDRYNLYYNVRNTIEYPNARLFVNYTLSDSIGNTLSKKMIGQNLFDLKTGKPNGTSGLGDIYDHQFLILENYEFLKQGKYILKLEQFMREDSLPGILAVGVRVERVEAN